METNTNTPYTTELHLITVAKNEYATSLDERGFKPVFEYEINGQPILWDRETRDVFLTGIWKALGYTKVDVIKTIQCNPNVKTKKLRGGLLKIQGTWVPYQDARSLCLRAAWIIRHQLTPLFG
ncbi:transcription regulator HTH, apses-type DNA-binding domain-containing protein, partial [Absidia repens]